MNFDSEGLIISIIILILLMLICHISNFIYDITKKNKFENLPISMLNNPLATQYNAINYDNQCSKLAPCNQLNEAALPCTIISECSKKNKLSVPTKPPFQLSDSEWAVVYRDAYNSAGRELLFRSLNEISESTKTTSATTTTTQA